MQAKLWSDIQLTPWCAALTHGEAVAAPAEGVYGYCADPFNAQALQKLVELKQRDENKGFICLINTLTQLDRLCAPLTDKAQAMIHAVWSTAEEGQDTWPPVTLILPAREDLPQALTGGNGTVAVRKPHNGHMLEYLEAWGAPLVSTSLNKSGERPAIDAGDIPINIPVLTFNKPLSGEVSRIYNVLTSEWVR